MSLTLKQIEAYYWAATLDSFAIAAERLHITQSTLSKRIMDLEVSLDRTLFDRSRKKAVLTKCGLDMLPKVREILGLTQSLKEEAHDQDTIRELSGVCKFGISELSASTWLPHFIRRTRKLHPALVLAPQICLTLELEQLVQRGELDFAVIAGAPSSVSLASLPVAEIEFSWAASPQLATMDKKLQAVEFNDLNILSHPQGSGLALAFSSWLTIHNLKVRRVVVCNSLTTITSLTVANMGISFLPTTFIQPLVDRGHLVLLESDYEFPPLKYHFIWLKDDIRPITTIMKKLLVQEINFSIPNALWVDL